jgi:hypothetical protein
VARRVSTTNRHHSRAVIPAPSFLAAFGMTAQRRVGEVYVIHVIQVIYLIYLIFIAD